MREVSVLPSEDSVLQSPRQEPHSPTRQFVRSRSHTTVSPHEIDPESREFLQDLNPTGMIKADLERAGFYKDDELLEEMNRFVKSKYPSIKTSVGRTHNNDVSSSMRSTQCTKRQPYVQHRSIALHTPQINQSGEIATILKLPQDNILLWHGTRFSQKNCRWL